MTKRLVESLKGVGAIYAGDTLMRSVPYQLSVWSEGEASGQDGSDAATTIDGHIDLSGMGEAVVLAGADTLTLKLQDGRRMVFQLTSSSGAIVGRGGLLPA